VPWRIEEFAGKDHAGFEFFGALVIAWAQNGFYLMLAGRLKCMISSVFWRPKFIT
jgi:hypothetical protein